MKQCGGGYRTFHLGGDTTHEVRETQEGWTGRVKRYKGYTSNLGCMVGRMNNKKDDHITLTDFIAMQYFNSTLSQVACDSHLNHLTISGNPHRLDVPLIKLAAS